jgi:hypothetical protein
MRYNPLLNTRRKCFISLEFEATYENGVLKLDEPLPFPVICQFMSLTMLPIV